MESIRSYSGEVLTAEGGSVQLNANQRAVIAALDNGTLLIAKSAINSANVVSARAMLERQDFRVAQVYLVDMEAVRLVYEAYLRRAGGSDVSRDTAQMQRVVLELIRTAAQQKCSDIHITVNRYEALIRVRSDGVMMPLKDLSAAVATDLCQAAFNMADASDASYKPFDFQGARISSLKTPLPEGVQAVRLQFNPLPDGGRYCVMRLLYSQKTGPQDIDLLGYSERHVRELKRMRDKPYGIVIISGPTGSGKSTTLQTALQATARLKNNEVNIITVEDPPEYEIRGAAQLPVVNAKTDEERREAFRSAITASLRSDPDIVMIGEIRDEASASLAFQAAMTGHQVYASLHANDALSILDRLRDQKVEQYKLSDEFLVAGLIGQRLVRRLCPHCKMSLEEAVAERVVDKDMLDLLVSMFGEEAAFANVKIARPRGCKECGTRGYNGRTVVAETILPDRGFMELISQGKKHDAYNYWIEKLDGMTMLEHAAMKMADGQIDPREIADKVGILDELDPPRVRRLLSAQGQLPSPAAAAAGAEA